MLTCHSAALYTRYPLPSISKVGPFFERPAFTDTGEARSHTGDSRITSSVLDLFFRRSMFLSLHSLIFFSNFLSPLPPSFCPILLALPSRSTQCGYGDGMPSPALLRLLRWPLSIDLLILAYGRCTSPVGGSRARGRCAHGHDGD